MGGYQKILADICSGNGHAREIGEKLSKDFCPREKESLLKLMLENLLSLAPEKLDEAAAQEHIPILECMAVLSHREEISISLDVYRGLLEYSERITRASGAYGGEKKVFLPWASLQIRLVGTVIPVY